MFTQTPLRFAPDGPIENKPLIMHAGNGSMPEPDMRQDGFLIQTEICQPRTGVKTWISIISL